MMRVLDLFSGIGGFSLGLERTGGFKTVVFCEQHQFAKRVLAARWPGVPCIDDVRSINRRSVRAFAPNVVTAGFPCQDISDAGSRAGIEGRRSGLWFEVARITDELRPDWLLLENVSAILGRGLDRVLGSLAEIGYDAWWDCVRASDLGYPHERDRWFAVAYPAGLRRDEGERSAQGWRRLLRARTLDSPSPWAQAANDDEVRSGFLRVVDGLPDHVDRLDRLGNAIIPEIPELIGRAILAAAPPPHSRNITAGESNV
jgi:DNA (cytosine-5)-methyltransferase 1